MGTYREPKDFWKLSDYMEAVHEAASPDAISPNAFENYEDNVRERITKVKKALDNLERFLMKNKEDSHE